jgi:hypothetical protein
LKEKILKKVQKKSSERNSTADYVTGEALEKLDQSFQKKSNLHNLLSGQGSQKTKELKFDEPK